MGWKTLDDINVSGQRVLTRVDVNVPTKHNKVSDATRIEAIAPTIRDIRANGGIVVLIAHFDRPKGKVVPEMSLQVVLPALEQAFGVPVIFSHETDLEKLASQSRLLKPGQVMLVENIRFHPGEEKNDPVFAAQLATLGDIYCNDAFSVSHRAHASTNAVAKILPCCAGRLMQAELEALEAALAQPQHPVVAVVGGAKVSSKLALLGNLIPKVDHIVIGGGMANTFLAAQGYKVGKSLCEHDLAETARDILAKAKTAKCEVILPMDIVVAREFKAHAENETLPVEACPPDAMILDAGPVSIANVNACFDRCKTLVWNGPLGAFELLPFNAATDAASAHAAKLSVEGKLLSVAGGGDTVAALNATGAGEKFSYISTAGGAFLEWLEGKTLPGVAALESTDG